MNDFDIYTTQSKIAKSFRISTLRLSILLNSAGLKNGKKAAASAIQQKIAKKHRLESGRIVLLWNVAHVTKLLGDLGFRKGKKAVKQLKEAESNYFRFNKYAKDTWIIFVDGAFDKKVGSFAYLIKTPQKEKIKFADIITSKRLNNNTAELIAAIEALKAIPETPKRHKIFLFSDSTYVVNLINRWLKLSTAELDKKPHKHLIFEIRKLAKKFVLHAVWVKSHNGCSENNEVDEMASEKLQDYFEKLEIEKDKNYLAEFEAQQNGLSTN